MDKAIRKPLGVEVVCSIRFISFSGMDESMSMTDVFSSTIFGLSGWIQPKGHTRVDGERKGKSLQDDCRLFGNSASKHNCKITSKLRSHWVPLSCD
ncbi:hypothetical protein TNCV_578221 [Trichonephila clavipes]|nr:hypothetical protein TNCV_578221 [Trichonephila clavipes]